MTSTSRDRLLERLETDLIGPDEPEEVIRDNPSDRYLTGILYPQRYEYGPEENDSLEAEVDSADGEGSAAEDAEAGLVHAMRPASAGISFAVDTRGAAGKLLDLTISCGTYEATERDDSGDEGGDAQPGKVCWKRTAHTVNLDVPLKSGETALGDFGLTGMNVFVKVSPWKDAYLATVALVNTNEILKGDRRKEIEEKTFFQVVLNVSGIEPATIVPRPSVKSGDDEDVQSARLLYRDSHEYAVGHTASASWSLDENESVASVGMTWLPAAVVRDTSSEGDPVFERLRDRDDGLSPLSAAWLFKSSEDETVRALRSLVAAYEDWIDAQQARVDGLPEELREQANIHLSDCRTAGERMTDGIALLKENQDVQRAFRLANAAIALQRSWLYPDEPTFRWRPFQLAFLLLSLRSVCDPAHPDRKLMDLLWFPTGGGKTEAYLSIIALTLFYRRIRYPDDPDQGAGVGVIMRYTLRLLTAQQFQRACALILACEFLRVRGDLSELLPPGRLGTKPFSIGLWVGGDATPNKYDEASRALNQGLPNTPAQLEYCPACSGRLSWRALDDVESIEVRCTNPDCSLAGTVGDLPVWTFDGDIYRELPSLLIGTADKFAQIVRKKETGRLFGCATDYVSPDLIIQDELHLISGPLGTIAGAYEAAIDILCSQSGFPPKIIGSTATIRRANSQVRALFDRDTRQFPPPGLDASNSGFAVTDAGSPGRIYVGVTTAGRSAKFTLQAVSASLLQSAASGEIDDGERDPYWTLVAYFNSLRELGGALVLMHDDVGASIDDYSSRSGEDAREIAIVDELTSRVTQREIRDKLNELNLKWTDPGAIDVLLATNMISVGVDIPRLGLMVVNGQPKGIAEYIQATSRVGRGKTPGLIVSVLNNAKARDRSHYETFSTWHSTLYREVEATSVTPYASRARDRTLHAPLVALVRHLAPDMTGTAELTDEGEKVAREVAKAIVERAQRADPEAAEGVRKELDELIEEWKRRAPLNTYWNDWQRNTSLLMSAEMAAAMRAAGRMPGAAWPTPNSLRNVDPGTPFIVLEGLAVNETEEDHATE